MNNRDARDWANAVKKGDVRKNEYSGHLEFRCPMNLSRWHRITPKIGRWVRTLARTDGAPTSDAVVYDSKERVVLRAARDARVAGCGPCKTQKRTTSLV